MSLEERVGNADPAVFALPLPTPPPQAGGTTADGFVRQWDADHDGTLSLDEIKKAAGTRFDELDRDHHGILGRKEPGANMGRQEVRQADADNEGTLDKNEYLGLVEKRFKAADKFHDGKLDKKELHSAAGRSLLGLFGSRQGPMF